MKRFLLAISMTVSVLLMPVALGAVGTAVVAEERVAEAGPLIKVDGDTIEFRGPDSNPYKFKIFSITGQLIKSVTVKDNPVKVDLPKGFYIIKCDQWTKRVMLK